MKRNGVFSLFTASPSNKYALFIHTKTSNISWVPTIYQVLGIYPQLKQTLLSKCHILAGVGVGSKDSK